MIRGKRTRPGFTLLEMAMVLIALAVMLGVGVGIVAVGRQAGRLGDTVGKRVIWRTDLAEQFRADVARAKEAPEAFDEFAAGPACLILARPDGGRVVYRWAEGKLTRIERAGGKDMLLPLPTLPAKLTGEFARDGGLISLRLSEPTKYNGPPRRADISAALGGDVR